MCGKNRFLHESYLINDQNVIFSPIQMQHCIFDHTSSKYLEKKDIKLLASGPVNSHMTIISELRRSTVDAQCVNFIFTAILLCFVLVSTLHCETTLSNVI